MALKKHNNLRENEKGFSNFIDKVNPFQFITLLSLFFYSYFSYFIDTQSYYLFIVGQACLLLIVIASGTIRLGNPLALVLISLFCFCPLIYQLAIGHFQYKTLLTGLFFLSLNITLVNLFHSVNDKTVVWAFFLVTFSFYLAALFYSSSSYFNFVVLSTILLFLNSKLLIPLSICVVAYLSTTNNAPKAEIISLCLGLVAIKFHGTFKKRLWKITYLLSYPVVTTMVILTERNISPTEAVFSGRASIWSFWTEQIISESPMFGFGPRSSDLHKDILSLANERADTTIAALKDPHSVLISSLAYGGILGVIVLYISLIVLISNRGTTLATFMFYFSCGAIHMNSASPLFGTSPMTILFVASLVLQNQNLTRRT